MEDERLNPIIVDQKRVELIPKSEVRRAMTNPISYEASAARDYYYKHYASEREKRSIRLHKSAENLLGISFGIALIMLFLVVIGGLYSEYQDVLLNWWWSL